LRDVKQFTFECHGSRYLVEARFEEGFNWLVPTRQYDNLLSAILNFIGDLKFLRKVVVRP